MKNFLIEGICRDIGKPLDNKNEKIAALFKKNFLPAYKLYSAQEHERLLEITPLLIYSWNYEFTKPYMEYWNFENREYRREYV